MKVLATRRGGWWVALVLLSVTGCASLTTVDFVEPEGSTITIRKREYVFPVAIRLPQRTLYALSDKGYPIELDIVDPASPGGVLTAYGFIYIYKIRLSDVDLMARNFFRIPKDKIQALKQGAAVTIEGSSADGGKPVYRAVIGLKKAESSLPAVL